MRIGSYEFAHICPLCPEPNTNGGPRSFLPQSAYRNDAHLAIHEFGAGPFCKFRIPKDLRKSGVYAICIDRDVKYIGLCRDLAFRYNAGYGQISPRKCFIGGQSTNCRINNLVYQTVRSGQKADLWFFETKDYAMLEAELLCLHALLPPWNIKGGSNATACKPANPKRWHNKVPEAAIELTAAAVQVTYEGYTIIEHESQSISILREGNAMLPAMPALVKLASRLGLSLQNGNGNGLNTRQLGSRIIESIQILQEREDPTNEPRQ